MNDIIFTALAPRGWKSDVYPHSHSSIGDKIGVIHGKDCWWKTEGQAKADYDNLVPQIIEELERCCPRVSSSDWITFEVYMIGKEDSTAAPTIMFFHKEKSPREAAMKAVKRSGILKQYPGFKTGHRAMPPGVKNLIQPAGDREHTVQPRQTATKHPLKVFYDPSAPIRRFGTTIYIECKDGNTSSMHAAAANVVRFEDSFYFQSVFHPFLEDSACGHRVEEEYDSDYEIAGDTDEDEDGDLDVTSRGSISPSPISEGSLDSDGQSSGSVWSLDAGNQAGGNNHDVPKLADSADPPPIDQGLTESCPATGAASGVLCTKSESPDRELAVLGSLMFSSTDKDWALISITSASVQAYLTFTEWKAETLDLTRIAPYARARAAPFARPSAVVAHIPSAGKVTGLLSSSSSYTRLPSSQSFQEVYRVQFNGPIAKGDCGSAIIDEKTGEMYGHIVAGCESTGVVYIMAAHHVFEDIEECLKRHFRKSLQKKHPLETPDGLPSIRQFDEAIGERRESSNTNLNVEIIEQLNNRKARSIEQVTEGVGGMSDFDRVLQEELTPPFEIESDTTRIGYNDQPWRLLFSHESGLTKSYEHQALSPGKDIITEDIRLSTQSFDEDLIRLSSLERSSKDKENSSGFLGRERLQMIPNWNEATHIPFFERTFQGSSNIYPAVAKTAGTGSQFDDTSTTTLSWPSVPERRTFNEQPGEEMSLDMKLDNIRKSQVSYGMKVEEKTQGSAVNATAQVPVGCNTCNQLCLNVDELR